MLALLCALQLSGDTLRIRTVERPPPVERAIDSSRYGRPQLRFPIRQGVALIWLLRSSDTLFIAAVIPDTSLYWGDDFVVSLNPRGEGGSNPGHDDFQWYVRRAVDSTVIYRGRNGHWEAPRGDPDWRLGKDRSGGGWELSTRDDGKQWNVILRLDPEWLEVGEGRLPRIAFRIYDNSPQGWFAWPRPPAVPPNSVEETPSLWGFMDGARD